jgi:uncharacterized protein
VIPAIALAPLLLYPLWEAVAVRINHLRIELPKLPSGLEGLSMLLATDLHVTRKGRRERHLERLLCACPEVDLLLIGGDVARCPRGMAVALDLFAGVRHRLGAFAVLGNSEHKREAPTTELIHLMEKVGVTVLNNAHQILVARGTGFVIAGVDDPFEDRDDLPAALNGADPAAFLLLLSHSPEVVLRLGCPCPDLILAGHTHGGQIRLPGMKALYTHNSRGVDLDAGLFGPEDLVRFNPNLIDHPFMYVSRGIGTSRLPVRFLCPPEVTFITLDRPGGGGNQESLN